MKPGRLLVVDDSETIRWLLEEHLLARGHEVVTAASVSEGLEKAMEFRPDLILSDLRLGDSSGLDLIRTIKSSAGAAPACVLLTGFGTLESAIEAIRCGADEYLLKPVDLKELDAVVGLLLERQRHPADAVHGEQGWVSGAGKALDEHQALRYLATPLALLRAYLEMLGEGRFGPMTALQEEKIGQARDCLREVSAMVRGAGQHHAAVGLAEAVEQPRLEELYQDLFKHWSDDFERRGVQVVWSLPPLGPPLRADLSALRREADGFLADSLARCGPGMTLKLEWTPGQSQLALSLRLEAAIMVGARGALSLPSAPLAALAMRLTHAG